MTHFREPLLRTKDSASREETRLHFVSKYWKLVVVPVAS